MNPAARLPDATPGEQVCAYHARSKHAFERYAASPGHLDWDTQPDPFRRYAGAPVTALPLAAGALPAGYADLFTPGRIPPAGLELRSVGALLELSVGLAAWKEYGGDRWALRCNPSSGNLHPTETYVVSGGGGLADGVHHYLSHDHALEWRGRFEPPFRGLLVGFSSIHWREAWKYGERAFRYCQHDLGHALGALRYAAAALGWRVRLLDEWGDADLAALLGLDREEDFTGAEREAPDLLCLIETGPDASPVPDLFPLLDAARQGTWQGRANALSRRHECDWPVLEQVQAAAGKPRTSTRAPMPWPKLPAVLPTRCELPAATLIRQRRSAQAFDGVTAIPAQALFRMLDATLPRPGLPPFDAWNWPPHVHLALFVHRVQGLPPGLYVCCRDPAAEPGLRAALRESFVWQPAEEAPDHLRLSRLVRADARQAAKTLSCHQDIAGDGAFSLGMLAEFDAGLAEGPWGYRRLFWECGLIGQALYLEAEAAGVRGTGIGCYFDDPMHELLGIADTTLQSLYHFTVGSPLVDHRLKTLPPYGHLGQTG